MIVRAETSRFGPIEVDERVLLTFPTGIIGFPRSTRFVVLDHDRPAPFKWLQSTEEPDVAFAIMDPADLPCGYEIVVGPEEVAELGICEPAEFIVLLVVTIPTPDPSSVTANLRGPIIVNERTRLAKQVVLSDERPTRFPVFAVNRESAPSADVTIASAVAA